MTLNEKLFSLILVEKAKIAMPKITTRVDDIFLLVCQKNKGDCDHCCLKTDCLLYFNGHSPIFRTAIHHSINTKLEDSDSEIIFA